MATLPQLEALLLAPKAEEPHPEEVLKIPKAELFPFVALL